MTHAERLARIEAILERLETKVDALDGKVEQDVADLAALKNRGTGILVGVALAAGSAGAGAMKLWQSLFN